MKTLRDLEVNEYQLEGGGPHDAADVVLARRRQIDGTSSGANCRSGRR
ncbi:MAG: hypothetical protein L0332_23505 [Chloroflexi bacterium]|nr:hypothetical protein [Chloroflexota bacterium]